MIQNAVHFVASDEPAGTFIKTKYGRKVCPEKSAGHTRHEYTTGYAHDEILKQFGLAAGEPKKAEQVDPSQPKAEGCDIL